ncbi:MAG TPA: rhodanese-like domain-containing protein [Anaerolineaceae bacterium]|nr:rhodanese-like domain-containing protein [Anaerolineaceae bacterium]
MTAQTPRRPTGVLPFVIILLGLVLLIAGIYLWNQNNQPAAPQTQIQPTALVQATQAAEAPFEEPYYPDVKRVSLADAKAAFDAKTAVMVDVRDLESYAAAHIPGALNIPLTDLSERIKELDPDQWIITYCT